VWEGTQILCDFAGENLPTKPAGRDKKTKCLKWGRLCVDVRAFGIGIAKKNDIAVYLNRWKH